MSSPAQRDRVLASLCRRSAPRASWQMIFCNMMFMLVLALGHDNVNASLHADATSSTATLILPTTSTTTTTSAGSDSTCGGVTRCLNDTQCARCLLAINTTRGFAHTPAEYVSMTVAEARVHNMGFYEKLLSTASCSTNTTPPGILHPALLELSASLCGDAHGMVTGECILAEYACFAAPDCRRFLASVYSSDGNGSKAEAVRSLVSHTATIGFELMIELEDVCEGSFPLCTFNKQLCANSSECSRCLATLGAGDGAAAARQCRGSTTTRSALYLDQVVGGCSNDNAVACSFWSQRCADNFKCRRCLAVMGNEQNTLAAAADWSTLPCQRLMQDAHATTYIQAIYMTDGCPAIGPCRRAVAQCVLLNGDACISCLNGSAPPSQAAFCASLQRPPFSLGTACQPCPNSVHTINTLVLITMVVGGASATACVVIAATIVAHEHTRVSMWHRIVVGLMLSNAVYSTANAIPLNALYTGVIECGRLAMSFDAIRFGRAWWFCGKYGLVSFELFVLGASIRALFRGTSAVPSWAEATMHVACWTSAFVAFAVFYSLCSGINKHGYNANTESEAYTGTFNYVSLSDDLDDDATSIAASFEFEQGRAEYDDLVRDMLVAWDAVVGLAVALWVVLRLMYLHALRMLHTKAVAVVQAEASDVWATTRRNAWAARRLLLEARKEAFNEVAKPLEPYIAVFVVFAVPAVVMSTSFCQAHSGVNALGGASTTEGFFGTNFSYATCDVWCEFVLAFRSLSTVAVYLLPRERRIELVGVRTTWRKLVSRAVACCCCHPTQSPYGPVHGVDHGGARTYEMLELTQESPPENDNDGDKYGDETIDVSTWHINECDVVAVRRLGQGAFGEVWEGVFRTDGRKVAIKMLFAGAVDEDGDLVAPSADEDFHKECAALRRIDSPHLIKFYGFGTTKMGNWFMVTELMGGGSLQDVLYNHECDLPWRTRVSLGLQVALGMDHLHQRHLLHRDLKSANVLVDEHHTIAKVCDFGLSRAVKPTQRHVVSYSPFTGVTRLLPRVDGVDGNDHFGHNVLSMSNIAVGIEDARGNMTKAAGTLLWMAPEVFRGDQNYTGAVDVYSFGIVLWELAMRRTPWTEFYDNSTETAFFQQLNRALQTGRRPTVSNIVTAEHSAFVAVMSRCWAGDPADRPSFSEAARDLAAVLRSETLES